MPLAIVYEDRNLVVLNRSDGLVVRPGADVPDRTLMNAALTQMRSEA